MSAQESSRLQLVFRLTLAFLFLSTPVALWPAAQPAPLMNIHEAFAQIGTRVAAFGGAFVDEDNNTLYVYMVPGHPGTTAEMDQALTDVMGAHRPVQHHLAVLEGRYTFLQLQDWCALITRYVLPMSGVALTGIDDRNNRLIVGLETEDAAAAVAAQMSLLGIPREAFNVQLTGPARPEGSLEDRIRPLYGGLQIQRDLVPGPPPGSKCTLGVVALRQGKAGFITASHCGNMPFQKTGTKFSQPLKTGPDPTFVGTELINPPLVKNLTCSRGTTQVMCPPEENDKRPCRCSDSLFAEVSDNNFANNLGYIARPDVGGLTWAGGDNPPPTFTITGKSGLYDVGQSITKVGIGAGRREGKIMLACTYDKFTYGNLKLYILCVNEATYMSAGGDSGSPVFVITNAQTSAVTLTGIHTGSFNSFAIYSTIDQIENQATELGPLIVCANEGC